MYTEVVKPAGTRQEVPDHVGRYSGVWPFGHDIIQTDEPNVVNVSCRFCPGTVSNTHKSDRVALVVWNPQEDFGYQLVGRVREFNEIPDRERQLKVRVEQIFDFTQVPHSDEAIS